MLKLKLHNIKHILLITSAGIYFLFTGNSITLADSIQNNHTLLRINIGKTGNRVLEVMNTKVPDEYAGTLQWLQNKMDEYAVVKRSDTIAASSFASLLIRQFIGIERGKYTRVETKGITFTAQNTLENYFASQQEAVYIIDELTNKIKRVANANEIKKIFTRQRPVFVEIKSMIYDKKGNPSGLNVIYNEMKGIIPKKYVKRNLNTLIGKHLKTTILGYNKDTIIFSALPIKKDKKSFTENLTDKDYQKKRMAKKRKEIISRRKHTNINKGL